MVGLYKMHWSSSDCTAKAQSKTTDLLDKITHKDSVELTLAEIVPCSEPYQKASRATALKEV